MPDRHGTLPHLPRARGDCDGTPTHPGHGEGQTLVGTMRTSRTDMSEAGDAEMERISSLLDGELDRAEAETLVSSLCADSALLQQWRELHRVGDALRSSEVAVFDDSGFCAKVSVLIAAEPTV